MFVTPRGPKTSLMFRRSEPVILPLRDVMVPDHGRAWCPLGLLMTSEPSPGAPLNRSLECVGRAAAKTSLDRAIDLGSERHPCRHAQLGEHVPEGDVDGVRRDVRLPGHGTVCQSRGHRGATPPAHRGEAGPAARRPVPRSSPPKITPRARSCARHTARPGLGARVIARRHLRGVPQERRRTPTRSLTLSSVLPA